MRYTDWVFRQKSYLFDVLAGAIVGGAVSNLPIMLEDVFKSVWLVTIFRCVGYVCIIYGGIRLLVVARAVERTAANISTGQVPYVKHSKTTESYTETEDKLRKRKEEAYKKEEDIVRTAITRCFLLLILSLILFMGVSWTRASVSGDATVTTNVVIKEGIQQDAATDKMATYLGSPFRSVTYQTNNFTQSPAGASDASRPAQLGCMSQCHPTLAVQTHNTSAPMRDSDHSAASSAVDAMRKP